MIKRLLNPHTLLKITLILTTLQLLPTSSWAAGDDYNLVIAGTTVTSSNASDILNDGNGGTGSVSFDGENTLTLNNARITINGKNAIESSLNNLNVYLVGESTITCQGNDDIVFKGTASNANITFSTSSSSYGSLQIQVNSEYQLFSGITPSYPDELSLYNEGYTYTIEATKFNIKVANIDVTAANASNILGGQFQGIVSYDANNNTLTLDNAQIDLTGNGSGTVIEAAGIDYFKDTNFTVKLIGTNSIKTNECEPIRYNGINDNKPTLMFSKENGQSCSLELSSGSTISGFSEVILNEGLYLSCSMPLIYDQSKQTYVDHTGEPINNLTITSLESYPLWIGGEQLTANSSINGVSFTQESGSSPSTLHLNNFKFDNPQLDGIVWTKNKDLAIQFCGNNIINCRTGSELNTDNGYCIYSASSSNTLTLTATNNESTLTLTPPNGGSNNSRKPIGGFSSFSLSEGCGMYSTENYAPITEMSKLQEGKGAVVLKGQPTGLKIAGVYVTTENKNNVTGNNIATTEGGSISFEPAVISQEAGGTNTPATLTLNKATINGQIESTIEDLHVRLIGSNNITPTSADDAPIIFSSEGMVLDVANLTLESSEEDNGEINLKGAVTKSGSNNSINLKSDIYRLSYFISNEKETDFQDISHWDSDIKYWILDSDNNHNNRIFYNPHYGITVGNYPVTSINKDMVTYLGSGDITYSSDDNTLHIPANSSLSDVIISSHRNDLELSINGECTLKAIGFEENSEFTATSGTLTFKQGESGKDQLTLSNNPVAIYGFSDVLFEGSMQLISPTNKSDLATATSVTVANYTESYNIIVENRMITDGNADDVLGDGTVSYNKTNNTLTLNEAKLTQPLYIIDGLKLDLVGENSIILQEIMESPAINGEQFALTIQSTSKTGSLILQGSGGCEAARIKSATITKPLVSSADLLNSSTTYATIHLISAPIMENHLKEDTGLRVLLYNPDDNGGAGTIKYNITYADQSTGITNQTYSSEGLLIAKPGTMTAWVELDSENKSSNLVGKYFGYKQNPAKVVYNGTDAVTFTPELEPAIESTDKISVSFTSVDVSITDNTATLPAFGSYMITGQLTYDPNDPTATMVLNPDTIKVNVQAVPATPTIVKEDRTYISTEKITITSSAPNGTTICYKWDEGNEQDYTAPIEIEGTTLHAWVKYQSSNGASGGSVSVYSNPTEATFTVIPDISELDFTPSSIDNITYTGKAITPSVTITNDGETISSDNYTVKTVQEIEGEQTVVDAINVGSYTLVIEGKNDFGGKKDIPFTISQADMASITIEPISRQTYTGDDLTPTLSVKLGEDIVASDEYTISYTKNGATTTEIKEAGTYTVTLTSTNKNFSTTNTKSATFTITPSTITPTVEITGWTYGTTASTPTVSGNTGNGSVTYEYKLQNAEDSKYSTEVPNEAGDYTIKATIAATANYEAATDSAHFTISKATPSITFDKESYSAVYGETFTAPTASTYPEGLTVIATSSSNTQVATVADGVMTIAGVGETIITVSFAGNNNYEAATATYTLDVGAGTITDVTANGYTDTYDGKSHGITVTAPEHATIKYGTKKGTYDLDKSPTYTDAGTYMVHYQVECTNYATITDSAKVEITKANITPTISLEGWVYGTSANTPEVKGNTGNGAETFTYKAEGADTFSSEVPTAVGTHTVKVTIAETANYNGGEATATFTIINRTIDTANDIAFAEGQTYASFYSSDEDLELPETGIAVYMITGIEGNTLTTQAVSYIPKTTPVLVEKTETAVEVKDPSEVGTNLLQYATEDVTTDGTLYILYNGEYVKATGTIPQGKCYLKPIKPSGSRRLAIGHNNGTTGISDFDAETETDRWYDLNGQRISKPQKKGVYINNGRKIVVK